VASRAGARNRLTFIYAGLFLLTGALLLALNDGLVHQRINDWQQHKLALDRQLARHPAHTGRQVVVPGGCPAAPTALPVTGPPCRSAAPGHQVPLLPSAAAPYSPTTAIVSVAVQSAQRSALGEAQRAVLTDSVIALAAMTAAAGLIGWFMAGRVLRPVHVVSATARRLSEHNLNQRIPATGPHDEMRELAETINDLLARLDRAFTAQRNFVANASHELRTPIAMHRALAEVTLSQPGTDGELRALATDVLTVAEQQERTLSGLLALAKSQHGIEAYQPVDLAAAAARAIADHTAENGGHNITVDSHLDTAVVSGSPPLVDLLVTNLIRNAFRHNTDPGRIHVRTQRNRLMVENTGPVLTSDDITRLCEPFRRGTGDRTSAPGTGLGLPIILAVADAHHATVRLEPRGSGGLRTEVTFPLTPTN
jgi:signal transduction histidine kinase